MPLTHFLPRYNWQKSKPKNKSWTLTLIFKGEETGEEIRISQPFDGYRTSIRESGWDRYKIVTREPRESGRSCNGGDYYEWLRVVWDSHDESYHINCFTSFEDGCCKTCGDYGHHEDDCRRWPERLNAEQIPHFIEERAWQPDPEDEEVDD